MRYGDLHSDTLTAARGAEQFLHMKNAQISLEKLIGGDCVLQCFALFSRSASSDPWGRALPFLSAFRAAEGELKSAGIRGVLTIEDGGLLENDLSRLETLLAAGVKMFGFTWNDENCLGFPCGMRGGLKPFGRRVAEELFSRGIYADVSHLSDDGFFELADMAKAFGVPLVASHSLARGICPHRRNLTDAQIKTLAQLGGVVGVNFVRRFAGAAGLAAHVKHIVAVGGEDVVAIGTDFDGSEDPLYAGADEMPRFFEDMKRAGLSPRLLEKLALTNVLRIFPPPLA